RETKACILGCNSRDELGFPVRLQIVLGTCLRIAIARSAERSTQVSDHVLPAIFAWKDGVVGVFKVPVADQCHHYPQTVELARLHERVVPPAPVCSLLFVAGMTLQTHSRDVLGSNYVALPTVQVRREALDFKIGNKVVLIGKVADGPQQ